MTSNFAVPSGWTVRPLPEVVFFQEGPGLRNWQYRPIGIPFVNIRCIKDGRLLRDDMTCLDPEEVASKYRHFLLDAGDFVVSSSGTLGRLAEVHKSDLPCMLNTSVIRFRPINTDDIDREFLKVYLLSDYFGSQVLSHANGSAQLNYGPSHLKQMSIVVPPIGEQRQIGEMVASLDRRINLLRETNGTLDAIGQALFKSWFIDFDPVWLKKQKLVRAGADEAMTALLPDGFVDSAMGPVPVGWEIAALDKIATFLNGLALQKFPPSEDAWLPVIKIAQLRKGDTVGADRAGTNIKSEYVVKDGDVLFSWSGSLEVEVWCGGVGALNQHLFKVTSKEYPKWFYFHWTRYHLEGFRQIAASKATTMGHIQRAHLTEALVLVPPAAVIDALDPLFASLLDRKIENEFQARTLASLRDTLLPRLIYGQLRLPVEEALAA